MERLYYRPLAQTDACRPAGALTLAGGWCWFDRVEVLSRGGSRGLMAASDLPSEVAHRLTASRAPLAGMRWDAPQIMGIVNTTPDSFSDGGRYDRPDAALAQAEALLTAGADLLDIGGESTRPGAVTVPEAEEVARTAPLIAALRSAGHKGPISIDTRKAAVAAAAVAAGADLVNDVAAMTYDPAIAGVTAQAGAALCLMHAQGSPETMQAAPRYDDVLLDVYDFLEERIAVAEAAGIPRGQILTDPGLGFGKTVAHNLALINGLSLFHGLGCAVLLGTSRKRFIGTIGQAAQADQRMPGTLAVTLAGLSQGIQLHRVHDVQEIAQGIALWRGMVMGYSE